MLNGLGKVAEGIMGPKEKLVNSPVCMVLPLLWEGRIHNHHILIEYREILSIQSKWDFILWYLNPRSLTFPLLLCIGCPTAAVTKTVFISCNRWSKLPQMEWLNTIISYSFGGQFSSVTQSCPTLCDPMDSSTPGFPVYHQLLELAQTHVHGVSDTIQPSHPLSSPSTAFNLSQHQGLFKWVSSSNQVAEVLELQLQHQSFQWLLRTDFL